MTDLPSGWRLAKLTGLFALVLLFGFQARQGLRSEDTASGVLGVLALVLIGVAAAFLIARTEREMDDR